MGTSAPLRLGRTREGYDLTLDLSDSWHTAVQGMSRSGKSVATYALLAPLASSRDVVVCGVDTTGILLNPWRDHPGSQWRHLGTGDMVHAAETLEALTDEMDRRIAGLLEQDLDKLDQFNEACPLLVVVLEEYPGTLSAAEGDDAASGAKAADRVQPRIKRCVRRLVQEGAKVGVRLMVIAQRMDASIVGGAERSNLGNRITLRVDNSDAVSMLHPMAGPEVVDVVTRMPVGRAIVDRPGEDMAMVQVDFLDYKGYVRHVREHAPE